MKKVNNLKIVVPIVSFILSFILVIFYVTIDYSVFENQISKVFMKNSFNKVYERESYFQDQVKDIENVLLAIRKNDLFHQYLQDKKNSKKNLESLFQEVIMSHSWMMQIRFINHKGIEEIRFDRENISKQNIKSIKSIKSIKKLQDKSAEYYFQENITHQEKVWFSKLDLNRENGSIEEPFKPTFRVVLPVVDKEFQGILVINYFAQPLLEKLFNAPLYDSILVDKDGYILHHYEEEKRWSRFQEKPFKIKKCYLSHIQDSFFSNDKFVLKKLDLPFQNEIYMILQLNSVNQFEQKELYKTKTIIVVLIYMFVMLFINILLYLIFKQLELNELDIQVLTKSKKKQDNLLIQQSKMASMGEMLANIAHQWRQPLAIIAVNTTNLERKNKNNKTTKEFIENYIDKINYTIKNMSQTIEDFSAFFKPNKEKISFDLTKSIDEALIILNETIVKDHITIQYDNTTEYNYKGYRNELLQVLLNIIKNAKDAIKIANITNGTIKIIITENNNNYEISIADNGTGIPEEIIDKIFEPYFTTKFQHKGTGIGLYMCKIIIEDSLQGEIELKNKNNGTLCTIKLPKEQI